MIVNLFNQNASNKFIIRIYGTGCNHGYRIYWIRPRLSFMTPLVIFFHVDSFQKVLIKPARHLLRLNKHLHASSTHAAHTNLAFTLTLAQGGNICKTLFDTCFLAVECRGGYITTSQRLYNYIDYALSEKCVRIFEKEV